MIYIRYTITLAFHCLAISVTVYISKSMLDLEFLDKQIDHCIELCANEREIFVNYLLSIYFSIREAKNYVDFFLFLIFYCLFINCLSSVFDLVNGMYTHNIRKHCVNKRYD
jgi:hypothetical protein